jgi:hypothetical protein
MHDKIRHLYFENGAQTVIFKLMEDLFLHNFILYSVSVPRTLFIYIGKPVADMLEVCCTVDTFLYQIYEMPLGGLCSMACAHDRRCVVSVSYDV